VGAISEDGKAVVVAADRMVTYGPPMNLQLETQVRKIVKLNDTVAILFSGAVPDAEAVISAARSRIHSVTTVVDIAEAVAESYREIKARRVEENILRPLLGIGFPQFAQLVGQSATSQLLQQVLGMIAQHNLGLDFLVAGVDDAAHVCLVTHPGMMMPLDTLGYGSIGSGGLHATVRLSLGQQFRTVGTPETVYNVYEAKTAAEVSPGVGKLTDMAVITSHGVNFFEDGAFDTLASLNQARPALGAEALKKLGKLCPKGTNGDKPA